MIAPDGDDRGQSVGEGLRLVLAHVFGFQDFRSGQVEAILAVLRGEDLCVLLPTGAGKTLVYQVTALMRPGVAVVVAPITSLIDDQERRCVKDGIDRVVALHASRVSRSSDRDRAFRAIEQGEALFVFLTPERLQSQVFRTALGAAATGVLVNSVVIDEAHCVSEWGHDFRTAYLRVGRNLRDLCKADDDVPPPLLALTGTASPAVLRDVLRELQSRDAPMRVQRPDSFDRRNLRYVVTLGMNNTWKDRLQRTIAEVLPAALGCTARDLFTLDGQRTRSGIVFVPHVNGQYGLSSVRGAIQQARSKLEEVSDDDRAWSKVGIYAGAKPKDWTGGQAEWGTAKELAAERFKLNETGLLVSTKAFGMGIDKPNIRWTVHIGYPASIESFAQEAGRAGRDGDTWICVLIASPPSSAEAEALLDLSSSAEDRRERFESAQQHDLSRQLFFLGNSFEGVAPELESALKVLSSIQDSKAGARVRLARSSQDRIALKQEKALYRLSMVGVVDDYTIDYGARSFEVDLNYFDNESIDAAFFLFVKRVAPGKTALYQRMLESSPHELRGRIEHHVQAMLRILYDVVLPARLRALQEMNRLVMLGEDEKAVRKRIVEYLSDGPLASILLDIAESTSLDVREATRELDTVPAEEPAEWVATSARQLEAYPDHPVLLLVRGLGESFLVKADDVVVSSSFAAAFQAMPRYDLGVDEAAWLFTWSAAQLRNQQESRGWPLIGHLYDAWDTAGFPSRAIEDAEQRVLRMVSQKQFHTVELSIVLARRLRRRAEEARHALGSRHHETRSNA